MSFQPTIFPKLRVITPESMVEHSAILLTCIKQKLVFNTSFGLLFEWIDSQYELILVADLETSFLDTLPNYIVGYDTFTGDGICNGCSSISLGQDMVKFRTELP